MSEFEAAFLWSFVGAAADTTIHMMARRLVGTALADNLFNVVATRCMAIYGVMLIVRHWR